VSDRETLELLIKAKQQTDAAFAAVVKNVETTDKATKKTTTSQKALAASSDQLKGKLGQLGGSAGGLGQILIALGPAGMAAAAGIGAAALAGGKLAGWAADFASSSDELRNLSVQTRMSTTELQEWAFAAREVGGSTDTVAKAANKLTQMLGEGSDNTRMAVANLGLSFDALAAADPSEQFDRTIAGLRGIADQSVQANAAAKLFGEDATILRLVRQDTDAAREAAHQYGAVQREDVINSAAEAHTKLLRLSGTWQAFKDNLGAGIAASPEAAEAIDKLAIAVGGLGGAIGRNMDKLAFVAKLLGSFSGATQLMQGVSGLSGGGAQTEWAKPGPGFQPAGTGGAGPGGGGDPGQLNILTQAQTALAQAKTAMLPILDRENGALLQQTRSIDLNTAAQVKALTANKQLDDTTRKRVAGILWATAAEQKRALQAADALAKEQQRDRENLQNSLALAEAKGYLSSAYDRQLAAITAQLAVEEQEIAQQHSVQKGSELVLTARGEELKAQKEAIAAAKIAAMDRQQETQAIIEEAEAAVALRGAIYENATAYAKEAQAIEDNLYLARTRIQQNTELTDDERTLKIQREEAIATIKRYNLEQERASGGAVSALAQEREEVGRVAAELAHYENNKEEIIDGFVREGMSVDAATRKYKEHVEQLKETLGQIDYLQGALDALPSIIGQVTSALEEMGIEGAGAIGDLANQALSLGQSIASGNVGGVISGGFGLGMSAAKALFGGPSDEEIIRGQAAQMGLAASEEFWEQFGRGDDLYAGYYLHILDALASQGLPAASISAEEMGHVFQESWLRGAEGLENVRSVMGALEEEIARGVPGALDALEAAQDQVFQQMRTGQMSTKTGAELLGQEYLSLGQAVESGTEGARDAMLELIRQTKEAGVVVPEIAEAIRQSMRQVATGLTNLPPIVTPEDARSQAILFATAWRQTVESEGIFGAIDQLGPAFQRIQEQAQAAGFDISGIIGGKTAELMQAANPQALIDAIEQKLKAGEITQEERDTQVKALEDQRQRLQGVDALQQVVQGFASSDVLDRRSFGAAQQQAASAYEQLVAGGMSGDAAREAIAPMLGELVQAGQRFGEELSPELQGLLGDDLKVAGDAGRETADAIVGDVVPLLASIAANTSAGIPLTPLASGGIPRRDMPAYVHANEVVSPLTDLSEMIARGVEKAIRGAGSMPGRGGPQRFQLTDQAGRILAEAAEEDIARLVNDSSKISRAVRDQARIVTAGG
jgi:hypothetical protein